MFSVIRLQMDLSKSLWFFLVLVIISCLLVREARSEVYNVGDAEGWDSGVDYGVWSNKYNFSIGDILVFKYVKSQHDVYEVVESTFRSCDLSTGVLAKYDTGNDQISLTEAKKQWFICSIGGHCLGGMRFRIDVNTVSSGNNNSTDSSASSPQAQPPPPTQGSGNNGNGCSRESSQYWSIGIISLLVFYLYGGFFT